MVKKQKKDKGEKEVVTGFGKDFVLHNEVVTGGRVLRVITTGGYHEVA